MSFKRVWILFVARNREFFRDKASFGWNFIFPFLIVIGFGLIFGQEDKAEYKIGIFPSTTAGKISRDNPLIPDKLKKAKFVEYISFNNFDNGIDKLKHHKIDLLLKKEGDSYNYWVSNTSPKGYIVEKIMQTSLIPDIINKYGGKRNEIDGDQISYLDWLFPGIIGMNLMFSALWGVGYIVVRYRKNGVLKRLKATPLTSFEYLSSQMLSRIFIMMFMVIVIWTGGNIIFSFDVKGSFLTLLFVFFTGSLSMCALGLVIASRGTNEELTSGVINFLCWPMMFLSEVWFSIEGAPEWLIYFAKIFPLTHMLTGARKVMNDGATFFDVLPEISILLVMTLVFLLVGSYLFSWNE